MGAGAWRTIFPRGQNHVRHSPSKTGVNALMAHAKRCASRRFAQPTGGGALRKDLPMDFSLSPEIEDIRLRTSRFVEEHVLPLETDPGNYDDHENIRLDVLRAIQAKARAEGLWAPQAPKEYGGMDLPG